MKVAFVAGVFVACPFLFYQIWAFIAPGLYEEKKHHPVGPVFGAVLHFGRGVLLFRGIPFAFEFS